MYLLGSGAKGFHSYASRIGSKLASGLIWGLILELFPFIRFTNWKQVVGMLRMIKNSSFHSYASRIGSKSMTAIYLPKPGILFGFHSYASRIGSKIHNGQPVVVCDQDFAFPFIRFTNWKQVVPSSNQSWKLSTFPFIRFTNWKQGK